MPATHDPRPIGVFDSGIGGLTSVREIFRVLPSESVIYFGDTARLPYGAKSRETVTRFSLEIASFLVRQNVKCLLVACNTASSYALETLSQRLEVPVIGVIEPAARAAVAAAPHGRIGIIGTLGTVGSGAYPTMIERLAPGAAVISRACPLFVPLVEEGWIDHPVTRTVAEEYLREVRAAHLESLILGCTHYPLITALLTDLMGPEVRLVDSGAEAARATADLLRQRGQLAATGAPEHRFYLSDEPRNFARVAQAFLGRERESRADVAVLPAPRHDGRKPSQPRLLKFERNVLPHAEGSAIVSMGRTRVLCTATVEERAPGWLRGQGKGWVTAEYGMLPRSTSERTPRTAQTGGRAQEIQRLIGRSLRAVTDLTVFGERTIVLDCDVLEADGGTRTAAINGALVALHDAFVTLSNRNQLKSPPLRDTVAAISVGLVAGTPCLDLDYVEDSGAEVDMNVVMTGAGNFVEVQGTGESVAFSEAEMRALLRLARSGIRRVVAHQRRLLGGSGLLPEPSK